MNKATKREQYFKFIAKMITIIIAIIACGIVVNFLRIPEGYKIAISIVLVVVLFILAFYAIKKELSFGYYECPNCHNHYIPSYGKAIFSFVVFFKRRLKCPKCGERHWMDKRVDN